MADNWQRSGVEYIVKDSTRAGVTGVMRGLDRLERASKGVVHGLGRIAGGLAGIIGVGSVAGIAVLVKQQMAAVDAAAKWSDRLGMGTEALIGLQHAAELSGVAVNQVNLAFQRMTRRVAEAAQGTGESQAALKELGLDATALAGQSPDQTFLAIADALGDVTSQSDRVRLAFKLFDSEGVAMVNLLKAGRVGILAMMQDAEDLGLTLSRLDAAQIEAANDALTRAKAATQGLARQIALDLAPYVAGLADQFTTAATSGQDFGDTMVTSLETVAVAAAKVLAVVKAVTDAVTYVPGKIGGALTAAETESRAQTEYRRRTGEHNAFGFKSVGFGAVPVGPKNPALYEQIRAEQRQVQEIARQSMIESPGGRAGEVSAYFDEIRRAAEQRRTEQRARLEAQLAGQAGAVNTEGAMEGPGPMAAAELAKLEAAVSTLDAKLADSIEIARRVAAGHTDAAAELEYERAVWAAYGDDVATATQKIEAYRQGLDQVEAGKLAAELIKAKEAISAMDAELEFSIEVADRMAAGHAYAADQVDYERAVWAAYGNDIAGATEKIDAHRRALEKLEEKDKKLARGELMTWTELADQGLDGLSGTLTDIAMDFENAGQSAEQFGRQLAALIIRQMIMKPLVQGISDAFKSDSSGTSAETRHRGGIVGTGPVEPVAFHAGGLASDEVLAKLLKREVVLTERDADRLRRMGILNARGRPNFHTGGTVGGPAAASVAPMGRGERPNVSIKIDNQSGAAIAEPDVGVEFDLDEYIINAVLRDVGQGGRTRDLMRGGG